MGERGVRPDERLRVRRIARCAPGAIVAGAGDGHLAIESDTIEQRITEAGAAVTTAIGDRLLRCDSVESAAQTVTEELVEVLHVRAAQIWVVEPGAPDLRYVAGRAAAVEAQAWLDATAASVSRKGTEWVVGIGAPGVARGHRRAVRAHGLLGGRQERAVVAAFDGGAGGGHPHGVRVAGARQRLGRCRLEIGGSHAYPGHDRLPALLARVAHQLGAFLLQRRSLGLTRAILFAALAQKMDRTKPGARQRGTGLSGL